MDISLAVNIQALKLEGSDQDLAFSLRANLEHSLSEEIVRRADLIAALKSDKTTQLDEAYINADWNTSSRTMADELAALILGTALR